MRIRLERCGLVVSCRACKLVLLHGLWGMKISQCNRIVVVIIPEHLEDFTVSNGMQSSIRDLEFVDDGA